MTFKNGYVFTPDCRFEKQDFSFCGELITEHTDSEITDLSGLYIIPGLIDIHSHGAAGYDFCDGTQAAFDAICKYEGENGITALCSASMTLSEERLSQIYSSYKCFENKIGAMHLGINMEGPFFSAKKKGAQNEDYLKYPDIDMLKRLQKASGNKILLCDIAPELEGSLEFIKQAKKVCKISLGHTAANYSEAKAAFLAGASHITHFYNAMLPFSHREPGLIGAAFEENCTAELISDGIHVHPAVIAFTIKTLGAQRVCLISDSMMAAGLADGEYSLGGQKVFVNGKTATLADGTIAGSVTNLFDCMKSCISFGVPTEQAIEAATKTPAKAVCVYDKMGSLEKGKLANFVITDSELNIKEVYIKGKKFR